MKTEALKLALESYMAAFGQALEAHGIELQKQQIEADIIAREALAQLEQPEQEPNGLADHVIGCFSAAEAEGLTEALAETTDERLKDLVERRLMYAMYEAQKAQPKEPEHEPVAWPEPMKQPPLYADEDIAEQSRASCYRTGWNNCLERCKAATTPPQRKPLTDVNG